MPPPNPIPLGVHNPALIPKAVLLAEFTARDALVEELLSMLGNDAQRRPPRHALILGPPGFGKTALLHVLKHRIEEDPNLAKTWVPLLFDEENYHIGDLAGFWLESLRLAERALGKTGPASHETLKTRQDGALEAGARKALMDLLKQTRRRALLLVDNLDDMLAAVSDEKSQKRLRSWLREESQASMVGTAASFTPDGSAQARLFHSLFRPFSLERFSAEEMRTALTAMADARAGTSAHIRLPTREGYWRGLHILTGGSPRLLKMIYQLLERGVTPDFRSQAEGLLDASTADFKQRIESASRQQRRVFDAIAHAWDSVQIADISTALRMGSNQISAQIQALVDAQLIAIIGGSLKRKRYQVADRFTNMCCLMRFSHSGRSRFEWFIRTMNTLFAPDPDADPLERLRELAVPRAAEGDRKLHAHLLAEALLGIEEESLRLGEGHKSVRQLLRSEQNEAPRDVPGIPITMELFAVEYDLVRRVSNISAEQRSKLGYQPASSTWWCIVAAEAGKLHKTAFVEQCAKKAVELDSANTVAWGILGAVLLQKGRPQEALAAAEKMLKPTTGEAQQQLARTVVIAAKHQMPQHRAEAEKLSLEMAMKAPADLLSIMAFWRYLRNDVQACALVLPLVLAPLKNAATMAGPQCATAHFLALGVTATLLAAGHDSLVREAVEAAGVQEALDIPLQVIRLREDDGLRGILAPERLALAQAYQGEIEKRQTELQRTGAAAHLSCLLDFPALTP